MLFQYRHKAQELVCLAAVRQSQHNVVACHNSKVAMIDIQGVYKEGGGACAGQRSSNLSSYVATLADTRDNNLARTLPD